MQAENTIGAFLNSISGTGPRHTFISTHASLRQVSFYLLAYLSFTAAMDNADMILIFTRISRHSRRLVQGALLCGALSAFPDPSVADQTRWVSDHLATYVRSGPTDSHRIVGTMKSGQSVQVINVQGDYTQVRSEKGDTVWIRSMDLQTQPGPVEYVPQLQKQVAELKGRLDSADHDFQQKTTGMRELLDSRKARIDELEVNRQKLDQQLTQAQADLRSVQSQLGSERQQVLMRYFAYGGAVAGGGALFGLIMPRLFSRSRKRNRQLL